MLTRNVCKSQEDVEELFKRMILNILILNFDDHAKNFAYLMNRNGKWSLSPAYDITYSKGVMKAHTTSNCRKRFKYYKSGCSKNCKKCNQLKQYLLQKLLMIV